MPSAIAYDWPLISVLLSAIQRRGDGSMALDDYEFQTLGHLRFAARHSAADAGDGSNARCSNYFIISSDAYASSQILLAVGHRDNTRYFAPEGRQIARLFTASRISPAVAFPATGARAHLRRYEAPALARCLVMPSGSRGDLLT